MFRSFRVLMSAVCVVPCGNAVAFEDPDGKSRWRAAFATVDRCAKVELPSEVPEVPGGDIFGFLSPTDIGDPCSFAYAAEFTARAGKRDGRYATVTKKSQFAYTYSDRLSFAASPFISAFDWKEVTVNRGALLSTGDGMDHTSHRILDFDGLSVEASWRVLARAANQPGRSVTGTRQALRTNTAIAPGDPPVLDRLALSCRAMSGPCLIFRRATEWRQLPLLAQKRGPFFA